MNRKKQSKKVLTKYLSWPVLFIVFALLAFAAEVIFPEYSYYIVLGLLGIIFVSAMLIYLFYKGRLTKAMVSFAMDMGEDELERAKHLDVPYAFADSYGVLTWINDSFAAAIRNARAGISLDEIFTDFNAQKLSEIKERRTFHCGYREKRYELVFDPMDAGGGKYYALYLYDETRFLALAQKYEDDSPVVGLLYLDNYEEAMESVDEVKRSLLIALIDRKVSKYISDIDGVVKKLEKEKYLFIIKKMYLSQLETARFDILEDVKTVNIGNKMAVTISMGMGTAGESFAENYSFARTAIEMALARGGDQAVVKAAGIIRYYGGKSQSIEKATRVKARVKAQAFAEILSNKEELVIMGHTLMDIDCLGAAIGVWRIAANMGKAAHIIIGEVPSNIKTVIETFREMPEYPKDMFISKAHAMDLVGASTVLAVVDVNKPSITEAPELFDVAETVVVFDHHRQGSDNVKQAVLSYVEPYASSTCEMVAELIQYTDKNIRVSSVEADAMYAGIVIDTHNFTNQTGVRTFEAAAYLRKCGADVTRVRKLFRDSVESYRAKAEAIHNAEIYRNAYAISECDGDGLESPTIVGAQAANELLDIEGIKASFVLTVYRDKVYISARSMDEVNVQVLMEKLGGGGHRSIAGAQIEETDVEKVRSLVKTLISEEIKKGELS